jgi:Holliday junction resolvase RusA-like endonuclease
MSSVSFTISGPARGKGSVRSGKFSHFKDKKTDNYMVLVNRAASAAMAGRPPLAGPLLAVITIKLVPVMSASKKDRIAMMDGTLEPTKKPDVDNVCKAVFDGCKAIAMTDDVQVTRLIIDKVYSEIAGVDVMITERQPRAMKVAA